MDFKLEQKVKVAVTYELDTTLLEILNENNYKKPMFVIDNFLLKSKIVNNVLNTLEDNNINYVINDEIIPDPPIELISSGVENFNKNNCDSIIAIGGGSVIDAARGINIVRTFGGSIEEYVEDKTVPEFAQGLISIPTTSGTGSELSNTLVVTDTDSKQKLAVISDNAVSEYAVLDPNLLVTLPKELTIMTGLDAFSHAAEAYTSVLSSPLVDAICEKIMFLIVKYLPKAVQNSNDLEARERMMVAAAFGGWVMNNGGTHIGHSIAHVVGAKLNVPHGQACSYSLPGTLMYTSQAKPKKIKEIGSILGAEFSQDATDMEIGEVTAKEYKNFRDNVIGMEPFENLNISSSELLNLTDDIINERFAGNTPMPVTNELVTSLLKSFG